MSENIHANVIEAAEAAYELYRSDMQKAYRPGEGVRRESIIWHFSRTIMAERERCAAIKPEPDIDVATGGYESGYVEGFWDAVARFRAAILNQSHAPDQQTIAGADLCPRSVPASQSQPKTAQQVPGQVTNEGGENVAAPDVQYDLCGAPICGGAEMIVDFVERADASEALGSAVEPGAPHHGGDE